MTDIRKTLVIIRGAGDLATGTAVRLHNSGFPVIMLDIGKPTVIRRTVAFAQALLTGQTEVEGIRARKCTGEDALRTALSGTVAVVEDPEGKLISELRPEVVVDAIIAKRNLGTCRDMAPLTIALGPGFKASDDVDAVIETKRGHTLGRIIYNGSAIPNTGIPGIIEGYGMERVMHSPCGGTFHAVCEIGDIVAAGQTVAYVDGPNGQIPVKTLISGKIRGMLFSGLEVTEGFKVADVDPRGEKTDHTTCSDKAMAIAGGVLEAVLHHLNRIRT